MSVICKPSPICSTVSEKKLLLPKLSQFCTSSYLKACYLDSELWVVWQSLKQLMLVHIQIAHLELEGPFLNGPKRCDTTAGRWDPGKLLSPFVVSKLDRFFPSFICESKLPFIFYTYVHCARMEADIFSLKSTGHWNNLSAFPLAQKKETFV